MQCYERITDKVYKAVAEKYKVPKNTISTWLNKQIKSTSDRKATFYFSDMLFYSDYQTNNVLVRPGGAGKGGLNPHPPPPIFCQECFLINY